MAEHRMFSKAIIDSDAFLTMPMSAQCLYFHLSMRADDDGFVGNPRSIQRMIGATDDDVRLLIMKRFVIDFPSGILVIKHWKIHNIIQKDRYHETTYFEEKNTLTLDDKKAYIEKSRPDSSCIQNGIDLDTKCIQDVSKMEAEDKLSKDKLSKDIISTNVAPPPAPAPQTDYKWIVSRFNDICEDLPKVKEITDARKKRLKQMDNAGLDFEEYFKRIQASDFLCGRSGRGWRTDFDWICEQKHLVKIQEGNYDNKPSGAKPADKSSSFDIDAFAQAAIQKGLRG